MLASSMMVGGGLAIASAAVADSGTGGSGAVATLQDGLKSGGQITINDGSWNAGGGLIVLKAADGTEFDTYCIDLHNETQTGAKYQESDWSGISLATNPDAGKINWILQNSYPQVSDLTALSKDIKGAPLTADEAAAGTQAAIWTYSDHVKAVPVDSTAAALATYLIANATDVKQPTQSVTPTLTLTAPGAAGAPGAPLGPITIATTGAAVTAQLDEISSKAGVVFTDATGTVVLSDKSGKLIKPAKDGDKLYVKAPAGASAGSATISASTSVEVQVGRAFRSLNYTPTDHSQSLILAGSQTNTVKATATVSWTVATTSSSPSPSATPSGSATPSTTPSTTPSKSVSPSTSAAAPVPSASSSPSSTGGKSLAFTGGGGSTPLIASVAGALVLLGGGAVFMMRRRGRHSRTTA
ncbi:thioester domain-containing protein [Kitasatospora sp. NBC_01287]|uniref:thioester domain-containing protein n=1 Tax=Kitasatospora sp. NBC_01287 TaxID=2903573 RepID=UPI00225BFAFD|nr:thioester domain-containing protein [Kitasatospora sp. NBC_01287]MCX4746355.1 thioester domain-containing protein [Kitasatospora sp. NBC_01287]